MISGTIKIFVQLIFSTPVSRLKSVYLLLLLKRFIPFIMPIVPKVAQAMITGTSKIAIFSPPLTSVVLNDLL